MRILKRNREIGFLYFYSQSLRLSSLPLNALLIPGATTAEEVIAAITQHVPDEHFQLVSTMVGIQAEVSEKESSRS
jgi:hypothetical protein